MHEVEIQTVEQVSTMEDTERLVKILNSTYEKVDLEHVSANATQLNDEYITKLLILLKDFENLFDGNLVDWDTDPTELHLNTDSNPFHCKYYLSPRIKKETVCKEL